MFKKACGIIREGLYGFMGTSVISRNGLQVNVNATNGTAFMVAPGYLVTAAHAVHQNSDYTKPIHENFEVIRAPDIGKKMKKASFVGEYIVNNINFDIALLKIENDKDAHTMVLTEKIIKRGTNCGFLGFPLAKVQFTPDGNKQFSLFERFQGAHISNYISSSGGQSNGRDFYEIDRLMYPGSSGCPVFTTDAKILGMQVMVIQEKTNDNQLEKIDISLVVPSKEILRFLKDKKVKV